MISPADMPRSRFQIIGGDVEQAPGPAEIEAARLDRIVSQARGVYARVAEFAAPEDVATLTMHVLDRFDDGELP